MKKYTFILLIFTLIISSCNSVKVLGSWKSENANTLKDKNILVITRTANLQARVPFEKEIAKQLRSQGMKVTESYKKFPTLNPNQEMTEERSEAIRSILDAEGFNGIVLTVLKDVKTSTTVSEYGGGYYAGMPYSAMYPSYYGGFHSYYAHPMSYSTYGMMSTPSSYSVRETKTYILETVIYNLDLPESDQVVAIVTTEIKDPKNLEKISVKYVERIVADFK